MKNFDMSPFKEIRAFIKYLHIKMMNKDLIMTWARGYKTFFMLNSTELKIYHAHKC